MVPNAMRKAIVIKFHDQMGHFALDRTVSKILENYYFPGLRRYVRYHINCCPECVLNKQPRRKQRWNLQPIIPGKRPFVKSKSGNVYILIVVDNLTKYVKLYSVKDTTTKILIKSLKMFALNFGVPNKLINDRRTAYIS